MAGVELTPVEEAWVYTACPGCLAIRVYVPGGGFDCDWCWWRELRSLDAAYAEVDRGFLEDKLWVTRAEALIIDGPEPLSVVEPRALCELVEGLGVVVVVRGLGLLEPSVYHEASRCVHLFSVDVSALLAEEKPRGYTRVLEVIGDEALNVEVYAVYARRGAKAVIGGLARRGRPVVVDPREGFEDEARGFVEEARRRGLLVYLHGDSSYTLMDVHCPRCREVLVERRPWRVVRRYEPPARPSRVRCPRCGYETPLVDRRPVWRPRSAVRRVRLL